MVVWSQENQLSEFFASKEHILETIGDVDLVIVQTMLCIASKFCHQLRSQYKTPPCLILGLSTK